MAASTNKFNAFNYLVPATGTTGGFNIQSDFSTPFQQNFQQIGAENGGDEFHPSGVFIDNSKGKSALTITILETGQSIVTLPGDIQQVQYPAPMWHTATIQSASAVAGNGIASVTFVDFPVLPFTMKSIPFGVDGNGTVDNTGTQIVVPAGTFSKHCTVQNTDAANSLYLSFTNPATANAFVLQPGQAMTFPQNGFANAMYGRSSAAGGTKFAIIGA